MTKLTPGAHWIRAALQVNPYGYQGKNQPSTNFSSEDAYNTALLDECEALSISLIAVTDHWCADSAKELIQAASARGITALPGFEANSSEGIHLLVIFEAGTEPSVVNAAIGACGVDPTCGNGATGNSFKDILNAMTSRGALVIPAHINIPNSGLLTGRSGPPLISMIKDSNLHAVAVTPSQPDGIDQALIIAGSKPYDRKHPLAVVYADDIVHPDQLKSNGGTSWFKVSKACVESLKLAVRTPTTRVALTNPLGSPRVVIRQISWTGGFLDGVTIPFSSDLTALIGGRGTGKSTVVESLRYALGLTPLGKDATIDHQAIVEKVLRSGTVVRVEVEAVSPTPRRFTVERMVPDPPIVRDSSGTATSQKPADVVGLVEVFGQHELSELASNPESVAEMLRRFAGPDEADEELAQVLQQLADNRLQLNRVESDQARLEEELADIPRLEEQVQHFKETDVATRLSDMQRLRHDLAVFTEASQRTDIATTAIAELTNPQLEATLMADFEGLEESPEKETLERVVAAATALATELKDLASQANAAIATATTEIEAARATWELNVQDQAVAHSEVLRKLHEDGLEPDKYLDTTKALDALKAKQPRVTSYEEQLKRLQEQRVGFLGKLADHDRLQAEKLNEAMRSANSATGGVVIVRPMPSPNRAKFIEVISEHISGARTQITGAVSAANFSPRSFAAAARAGTGELEKFEIRGAQARKLIDAGEHLFRRLEEMTVESAVEVLLDVGTTGGKRDLRTIDSLSKGQRATALLLLLLGASGAPLVIDQPEDDLDNRFVYDGVVANLRKLKGVRQIVASTHNANVPVLGDAELIVALEGDGLHGRPVSNGVGSLDDAPIRSLAENILEGGPAAFNARQHLYGF